MRTAPVGRITQSAAFAQLHSRARNPELVGSGFWSHAALIVVKGDSTIALTANGVKANHHAILRAIAKQLASCEDFSGRTGWSPSGSVETAIVATR
jgi:hypothetical protein